MSNTLMTPDTAPRDAGALAAQGPFIHRRLAEQLDVAGFKCWANDRDKQAFITAAPADRAQMLLVQLQAYDQSRGGGGAPAPAAAPPPQAAPPPAQEAAPAPAPAATTGRQPRTATNGAAAGGVGNVVELLNAIKDVGGKLDGISTKLGEPGQAGELEALRAMIAASLQIQKIEVGLLCLFGEQVLNATVSDFIGEAVTYGATALELAGAGQSEGKG